MVRARHIRPNLNVKVGKLAWLLQSGYISEVLGRPAQPLSQKPAHAVVIAREQQSVGSDDSRCDFDVVLTCPSVSFSEDDLLQVKVHPRYACLEWPAIQLAVLHIMRDAILFNLGCKPCI